MRARGLRGWRMSEELRGLVRAFDLLLVLLAAPVVVPICVLVAVTLRLVDGPPVLYRARRLGRGGELFTMYKFRTMSAMGEPSALTHAADPRVTRLGRRLRRLKLDELPQLLNVVRGEMGLVGPRPEDPRYRDHMDSSVMIEGPCLPGITSPASVIFRAEEDLHVGDSTAVETRYVTDILPRKLQAERTYLMHAGLLQDLHLLLRSVLP